MYEIKDPLWQFVDHWQTLIAGLLAVAAGAGTIWVTIKSANREVAAAQDQTKAAQQQTSVMRDIERRRLAREGPAFHTMLEAAMGAVIEDVAAARELPPPQSSSSEPYSMQAYAMRQRVKRAGFAELRNAFVRFGERQTSEFLKLDKEIKDFGEKVLTQVHSVRGTEFVGLNAGLHQQLDRIEEQANKLRNWAAGGVKFCRDQLAKDLTSPEPF
jgi:hypothetical protein